MSEAQDLIDELNMWIERGTMPRMTTANTLILLEEIKRLTAEAEKWRNTALQLSNNHGQARNKVDNLEADYIISNRELLILQVELARRDEIIGGRMKVYIVTMYRNGDREKHSYVLGAFSSNDIAREWAAKEEEYRGGKYKAEIIRWGIDSPTDFLKGEL